MSELWGRVALVTGGASGLGAATVRLLAEQGAAVAVADVNRAGAIEVAREIGGLPIELDLRDVASCQAAVAQVADKLGALDVLANVAGIYPYAAIDDLTEDLWDDVLSVNLRGPYMLCRAALPHLRRRAGASIINVASGAGVRGYAGLSAYSASKAGLIGFSRSLALECAPAVRVNVVAPGPIANAKMSESAAEVRAANPGNYADPLGRYGEPREIAEVIAFLASDRASYVTGQTYHVNGGRWMG